MKTHGMKPLRELRKNFSVKHGKTVRITRKLLKIRM
jgi:hypothetical protein